MSSHVIGRKVYTFAFALLVALSLVSVVSSTALAAPAQRSNAQGISPSLTGGGCGRYIQSSSSYEPWVDYLCASGPYVGSQGKYYVVTGECYVDNSLTRYQNVLAWNYWIGCAMSTSKGSFWNGSSPNQSFVRANTPNPVETVVFNSYTISAGQTIYIHVNGDSWIKEVDGVSPLQWKLISSPPNNAVTVSLYLS